MKLWKCFHLSSTMAIDECSVRRKCDEITQLLILLTSCTLSFFRSFIHFLPLPCKLPLAPILPTFHPAPSFPTCSIFPVVLNQTQPPWLISWFFPIQFFFFSPLLSLMLPVSNRPFIKAYLLPCLVMEAEGSARQAEGYNKILPLLEAPGIAPGLFLAALP